MRLLRISRLQDWSFACAVIAILALTHTPRLDAAHGIGQPKADDEQKPQNVAPGEYVPTGPKYKVKVDRQVRVKMPDGVELGAVIVRPDSDGKFPAIMSDSPYRTLGAIKSQYSDKDYDNTTDGPSYFAEHGYAVVYYDVRGTGNSGGSSPDMYADKERRDGYDMVEWIAAQPWCDGNVGMWGFSYSGVDQWQVGEQNPPHLKTLIVGSANTDVYLDWNYPGGVLRPWMFFSYSPDMLASNFAPPNLDMVGTKWAEIWNEHLENNVPWGVGYIKNQLDSAYWHNKSLAPNYDRIKVPVLLWSGWADWYPTPILRAFSKINVPKKVFIGPWAHYWPDMAFPGPRIDWRNIMLSWFDHWLKGKPTGVMDTPPVVLFVRKYKEPTERYYDEDAGFWRYENEWPPARTQSTPMYLSSGQALARKAEGEGGDLHDQYTYKPSVGMTEGIHSGGGIPPWGYQLDQRRDEAYSLTYTTPPLEQDLEVTGDPQAILYASSSAKTAYFNVTLTDVANDGTSKLVTHGALLATHRNSHAQPEPLVPGNVYELKIDIEAISYVFSAGHRIRVDIASANFQNAWPTGEAAVNTIYHGTRYPSRVVLPVAPAQSPKLPTPQLPPSLRPVETADELEMMQPVHQIAFDPVTETVTMTEEPSGKWKKDASDSTKAKTESRSSFTVSDSNPAEATEKSTTDSYFDLPGGVEIRVESSEVVMSNKDSFLYLPHVDVTINGKEHFSKSWTIQVPRDLN
jgi:putative CocE/NonD family hydrolase